MCPSTELWNGYKRVRVLEELSRHSDACKCVLTSLYMADRTYFQLFSSVTDCL